MDRITPEERSRIMSRVRAKDTKPEMTVRRLVHGMGYRYRLHRKDLPGKPDLAFPSRKAAIFVHGCFWHSHDDGKCRAARLPENNRPYWSEKLRRNRERDIAASEALSALGWKPLTIWECWLKDIEGTATILKTFLDHQPEGEP